MEDFHQVFINSVIKCTWCNPEISEKAYAYHQQNSIEIWEKAYTIFPFVFFNGMPFPQYSRGPIETAFPLDFIVINSVETIALFALVFAAFLTMVLNRRFCLSWSFLPTPGKNIFVPGTKSSLSCSQLDWYLSPGISAYGCVFSGKHKSGVQTPEG